MTSVRILAEVRDSKHGPLDLVQLTGVKVGQEPRWYRKLINNGEHRPKWFDHLSRDGETLIVEPYQLDLTDLRDIVSFADRHSLNVSVSGMSAHYPTRTVSIHLTPKE